MTKNEVCVAQALIVLFSYWVERSSTIGKKEAKQSCQNENLCRFLGCNYCITTWFSFQWFCQACKLQIKISFLSLFFSFHPM